ncbi:PAS domain S-box protein [candidate division WOR-3 bacterium]|nr:PAS domain S-box protein [candidate division WOR-3 bacterium]
MFDKIHEIERMVENMGEGVIMTDKKGELAVLNPMAKQALGFNPKEKVTVDNLAKYVANQEVSTIFQKRASFKEYAPVEIEISRPHPHFLSAIQTLVKNENGEKLGIVTILRDITKEKEIDQLKADFISMVSHDLRSPLATVKNVIEIIIEGQAGKVTDAQQHLLNLADKKITMLNYLVEDLLDLSKIESGQMRMEFALVDVVEAINDVLTTLDSKVQEKKIQINTNLESEIPRIYGDYQRVVQILMNIIGNAVKFTDKGVITIQLKKENGYAKVSVKDTGPGIAPEDVKKIFDKFYQSKVSIKGSSKGVGLGLTIAKKLVEAHKGKIEVKSEHGKGSTFHILLPFSKKRERS